MLPTILIFDHGIETSIVVAFERIIDNKFSNVSLSGNNVSWQTFPFFSFGGKDVINIHRRIKIVRATQRGTDTRGIEIFN